jgi:hypothetical protein
MAGAAAFRQTTKVIVDREFSPAARSRALATMAKKGLAELLASGRASKRYRTFVDGREGAAEETVSGDHGVILYSFQYLGEITQFALGFLMRRSPVKSGAFRDSFFISVDGRFIRPAEFQPASVPAGAEIIISNTQPYDRKVDVQLVGGQVLRFSVPAGLYDDAVRALRRQYGNIVTAKRLYNVRFPGQYILRRGKKAGTPVEAPGLLITSLE